MWLKQQQDELLGQIATARETAATKNFLSQLNEAMTAFAENAKPVDTTGLKSDALPTCLTAASEGGYPPRNLRPALPVAER